MGAEILSQFKQNILKRAFKTAAKCCDAISNFFFYLPCGGEASFRNKCVKFASLKEGDCILDLCCGTGNLAAAIAKQRITVKLFGADISESAIEAARAKSWSIPVTFLRTSAGDLPFESSQFDKCFISFGLHHMSRNERRKTLAEVHRTLVPKGNLYVIDYNLPGKGLRRLVAVAFTKLDNKIIEKETEKLGQSLE